MYERPERPRGTMLTRLDFSDVIDAALARWRSVHDEEMAESGEKIVSAKADNMGYGYGLGADGKHYVVCTEGVGWEVSEDKNFAMDCYVEWETADGKLQMSMMPTFRLTFTLAEVLSARTEETVDLADFVRKFGDRLEVNFSIWHNRIAAPKRKPGVVGL